ncbi:MAG: hypothetical protein ACYTAU_00400 [Planctomycetota bacterium]|jgi:hypothetical protein
MRRPGYVLILLVILLTTGCSRRMYNPDLATRPYPHDLHRAEAVDIQVFREGPSIEIVNATARSYHDFDLWINQRFVRRVESLPAGGTIRLSLWGFYDVRGDRFSAGGLWRVEPPTPLRLAQIQEAEDEPLMGLVTSPED